MTVVRQAVEALHQLSTGSHSSCLQAATPESQCVQCTQAHALALQHSDIRAPAKFKLCRQLVTANGTSNNQATHVHMPISTGACEYKPQSGNDPSINR